MGFFILYFLLFKFSLCTYPDFEKIYEHENILVIRNKFDLQESISILYRNVDISFQDVEIIVDDLKNKVIVKDETLGNFLLTRLGDISIEYTPNKNLVINIHWLLSNKECDTTYILYAMKNCSKFFVDNKKANSFLRYIDLHECKVVVKTCYNSDEYINFTSNNSKKNFVIAQESLGNLSNEESVGYIAIPISHENDKFIMCDFINRIWGNDSVVKSACDKLGIKYISNFVISQDCYKIVIYTNSDKSLGKIRKISSDALSYILNDFNLQFICDTQAISIYCQSNNFTQFLVKFINENKLSPALNYEFVSKTFAQSIPNIKKNIFKSYMYKIGQNNNQVLAIGKVYGKNQNDKEIKVSNLYMSKFVNKDLLNLDYKNISVERHNVYNEKNNVVIDTTIVKLPRQTGSVVSLFKINMPVSNEILISDNESLVKSYIYGNKFKYFHFLLKMIYGEIKVYKIDATNFLITIKTPLEIHCSIIRSFIKEFYSNSRFLIRRNDQQHVKNEYYKECNISELLICLSHFIDKTEINSLIQTIAQCNKSNFKRNTTIIQNAKFDDNITRYDLKVLVPEGHSVYSKIIYMLIFEKYFKSSTKICDDIEISINFYPDFYFKCLLDNKKYVSYDNLEFMINFYNQQFLKCDVLNIISNKKIHVCKLINEYDLFMHEIIKYVFMLKDISIIQTIKLQEMYL